MRQCICDIPTSQKYSSWIFLYFLIFWVIHSHLSSEWASNKRENESIYSKFQKEIESLPRTVSLLGPLCVLPALNGCLLKYTICFVSTLDRCPSQQVLSLEQHCDLSHPCCSVLWKLLVGFKWERFITVLSCIFLCVSSYFPKAVFWGL